jgi:CubicO group peptidase (beta-lactamase class C family)
MPNITNSILLLLTAAFFTVSISSCDKSIQSKDENNTVGIPELPPRPSNPFPIADPESVGLNSERLQELTEILDDWYSRGDIVGGEILVVKDNKSVFHNIAGWRDREDRLLFEYNTICRIRSMTKPIVGTAVLMLAEDGLIDIDDPIFHYLGQFDRQETRGITIKQLLQHTSGYGDPGYPGFATSYNSLGELVTAFASAGPQNPPGSQYQYTDGGVSTLAYLVTVVSGIPVEEYIQQNIFSPLGMESSFCMYSVDDVRSERLSSTYSRDGGTTYSKYWDAENPQVISYFRGSGGVYSTTSDYILFLYSWLKALNGEDDAILLESTAREALTPSPKSIELGLYCGYLWWLFDLVDENRLAPFGHPGSDGTTAWIFPEEGVLVTYFTQSRGTDTVWDIPYLMTEIIGE